MEKIIKLILSLLRNNEYYQFMSAFKNAIDTATPATLNLETDYDEFCTAHAALNSSLLVDQGSSKTEELINLDVKRDRTWSAIYARVRATLICPIEKEVEAASTIKRVFDLYGNVRNMSYNEESAALSNLLEDLQSEENAPHCNTMGLNKWTNALLEQNNNFMALLEARNVELANKNNGDVKAARDVLDPLYQKITDRANALVELDMAGAELQAFIREHNQRIKYYKETLAARAGRNDSTSEEQNNE